MRGKRAVASEAWRLMSSFTFHEFQSGGHHALLREMGLTPGHMKALMVLDADEPRPMRAMADALHCDASTVTWMADGLEERGLVERKMLANDRRVKTLVLTAQGLKTQERLTASMLEPPESLLALDGGSLRRLVETLRKLPAPTRPSWQATARPEASAQTS
jgi:MarR family transcriptional regulator, organic hydroperoxide resistance regulator